jgi:S1-C subfamily serine protease
MRSNCHPERAQRVEGSFQYSIVKILRLRRFATSLRMTIICSFVGMTSAHATQIKIYISNGTGFFVSSNGYIITNEHVVPSCQRLIVSGISGAREAKVVARDQESDLALLKVNVKNVPFGHFSSQEMPILKGDRAVVVGFPGASTDPVTRDSEIVRTDVPRSGKWLALDDVLEHGNSGGPVFDTSGNIMGVVSAKAQLLTYNAATKQEVSREDFGAAIAAPTVEKFLEKNGVRYQTADTDIILPTDHITEAAREYIVKVRCEYKTERR